MATRDELLTSFTAAKEYVRSLQEQRNSAYFLGQSWSQEKQDELDAAIGERSLLARELTQVNREARDA